MKTVMAFLQARMGSTRLPGKVLLRIQGKTILERAIERLRAADKVHEVVVLTTTLDEDAAVCEEAARLQALVFRGSSDDVLQRFQQASEQYGPDVLVRATADNPLLDIGSVNRVVQALQSSNLDWCIESNLPVGAATEALTPEVLSRLDRTVRSSRDREHVTLYIKEHPDAFRVALLVPPDSLRRPELRLTVDTMEDFIFVEDLIQRIPESDLPVPLKKYLDVFNIGTRHRAGPESVR
jgi:spore coat polysaccharide biosynthesis protein SpsF